MKKFFIKKFLIYWLPVIAWMGLIFYLSSIPSLESGLEQDFILRKIAHILEFAILTFLFLRALAKQETNAKKVFIFSIIFSLFYSLLDEYHQTFVFGRHGSLVDVGIDSVGIFLMGIIWYYKISRNKGR